MYHQPAARAGVGGAYLYQWNDDRCNMKHNFICKYKPGWSPTSLRLPHGSSTLSLLFTDLPREQGDTRGRGTGEQVSTLPPCLVSGANPQET